MGLDTWTSYDLADFLLFSDRVYWRLLAAYNAQIWPAQVVTLLLGGLILAGVLRQGARNARLILFTLAGLWAWVAWAFLAERYQTINWAVAYVVPVFAAQAVILAAAAAAPVPPHLAARGAAGRVGAIIIAAAVFGYPLLAWWDGHGFESAEVFGLAPDPTVVATAGVLALWSGQQLLKWLAMAVALAWSIATALTLFALGAGHFFVAPLLVVAAALAGLLNRRAA